MNTNFLLTMLRNRNPKAYDQIKGMMDSGVNPVQWLKEQYAEGKITNEQLSQVRKYGSMFGFTITDRQIEEIVSSSPRSQKKGKKSTGWF